MISPRQPRQQNCCTYIQPTIYLPAPGASLYPDTRFCSNHSANRRTFLISQCRHRYRIQYPTPDIDQHATDAATAYIDEDKPSRRVREKKRNTRHPPTRQEATEPRQGQPHTPLPNFANKYFLTHRKCAHEVKYCNNKASKHQYTETFCNKRSGSTYGCT